MRRGHYRLLNIPRLQKQLIEPPRVNTPRPNQYRVHQPWLVQIKLPIRNPLTSVAYAQG